MTKTILEGENQYAIKEYRNKATDDNHPKYRLDPKWQQVSSRKQGVRSILNCHDNRVMYPYVHYVGNFILGQNRLFAPSLRPLPSMLYADYAPLVFVKTIRSCKWTLPNYIGLVEQCSVDSTAISSVITTLQTSSMTYLHRVVVEHTLTITIGCLYMGILRSNEQLIVGDVVA